MGVGSERAYKSTFDFSTGSNSIFSIVFGTTVGSVLKTLEAL
jgi:hypothetical protein